MRRPDPGPRDCLQLPTHQPDQAQSEKSRGMLLGYIVSQRGIEANPEKVSAIMKMGPIRDIKGVQRVTGCLAALSRFISRLGEKALPLYRLLKKVEHFSWTPEAEEALERLKKTLVDTVFRHVSRMAG